jgi:hypothetical protein
LQADTTGAHGEAGAGECPAARGRRREMRDIYWMQAVELVDSAFATITDGVESVAWRK